MSDRLNIIETLEKDQKFSNFARILKSSKVSELIAGAGPFTVFAPTNDAFGKVPDDQMNKWLLQPEQPDLAKFLSYHIVGVKKLFATKLGSEGPAQTLAGQEVTFSDANGLKVNTSGVQARNIEASNGIIHALDTVLTMPAASMAASAATATTGIPVTASAPTPSTFKTDGHVVPAAVSQADGSTGSTDAATAKTADTAEIPASTPTTATTEPALV